MVDAPGTPPRARPAVVTASSWLLIGVAAIQLISLILTLATIGTVREVMRDAYAGTSVEGAADFIWVFGLVAAVLTLLLAIGLVVLAMLNNRGRNGSRITTWVLGGILICCTGGNLLNSAAGGLTGGGSTSGDVPSSEEIARRLSDAMPSWYGPVNTLLGVLSLLALLTALILLALPAANEFFRKRPQAWEPPVPGAAYPGYPATPGYPSTPGYPPAPGYPGSPDQPGPASSPGQPGPASSPDQPGPASSPGQPGPASSPDQPRPAAEPGERRDPEPPAGS
ncbi:hypothetical protein ACIBPB_24855 [Micromonospora sp. NPDC049836]|uniref:hypothetical protein n=1 Tax=Micromonospora sp. NPDC049836 TaxID=3364274 RepID=UPI0037AE7775